MFWWKKVSSPWGINIEHERTQRTRDPLTGKMYDAYQVDDLRQRALNLCEYEMTHANFGMGFNDLMHLDLATFEEIEDRVHKLAEDAAKSMKKMSEAANGAKSNLLSATKKS